MERPEHVARKFCAAMIAASPAEVTVKMPHRGG